MPRVSLQNLTATFFFSSFPFLSFSLPPFPFSRWFSFWQSSTTSTWGVLPRARCGGMWIVEITATGMEGCTVSPEKLGADPGCGRGGVSGFIRGGAGRESETTGVAFWKRDTWLGHIFLMKWGLQTRGFHHIMALPWHTEELGFILTFECP